MERELPAFELQQNRRVYYVTFMNARSLVDNTAPALFNPKTKKGYQRRVNEARANAFAKYLGAENGISPTAVVLSYRDSKKIFKKEDGIFGKIAIPEGQKLFQVDGQHRIAGLRKLLDSLPPSDPKLNNYQFPVIIICPNLWADSASEKNIEFEEALQFLIMNKTQRGVPTDLVEQFLPIIKGEYGGMTGVAQKNLPSQVTRGIDWKPDALEIAEYLNKVSKIWSTKIQMANEEPRSGSLVNQKAFTDSLEPVFKSDLRGVPTETMAKLLDCYWTAIRKICPETFAEPTSYVLFRRTGVFVMNRLFKYVLLNYVDQTKEVTSETFEKVLKRIPEMDSDKWSVDSEWGQMGTSHKAINWMTQELIDSLKKKADQGEVQFKVR